MDASQINQQIADRLREAADLLAAQQANRFRVGADRRVADAHGEAAPEGQRTVVTETQGALIGRRVVRGREAECRAYYEGTPVPAAGEDAQASLELEPLP